MLIGLSFVRAPAAAVRSSLRQLESSFYTLLVDCGADIPLPVSPLHDSLIARRMAEVKATADAALQQMAMARADLVRVSTASWMRQQAEAHESLLTDSPRADSDLFSELCCSAARECGAAEQARKLHRG